MNIFTVTLRPNTFSLCFLSSSLPLFFLLQRYPKLKETIPRLMKKLITERRIWTEGGVAKGQSWKGFLMVSQQLAKEEACMAVLLLLPEEPFRDAVTSVNSIRKVRERDQSRKEGGRKGERGG